MKKMSKKVRWYAFACLYIFCAVGLAGCVRNLHTEGERREVEYVVCGEKHLPQQLKTLLEEKKKKPGTFTYRNSMYLYLVVCYGKKDCSGYSVRIEECQRTEDTLYLRTQLIGPAAGEKVQEAETFPYLVVRCAQRNVFCVIEA